MGNRRDPIELLRRAQPYTPSFLRKEITEFFEGRDLSKDIAERTATEIYVQREIRKILGDKASTRKIEKIVALVDEIARRAILTTHALLKE